jgi:putative endonuclease
MEEERARAKYPESGRSEAQTKREELKQRGMAAAVAYIGRLGWTVVARDWRCPAGSIGLIGWDGLDLVFVEVKVRAHVLKGVPSMSVSATKARRLTRIARAWLAESESCPRRVRFDSISIFALAEDRALLRHLRGALTIQA